MPEPRTVEDYTKEIRAWEGILNRYHRPVEYFDGAMAVHNFHKLALDHIIADGRLSPQEAEVVYATARDTFVKAMEERIRQLAFQSKEGEHGNP